MMLIVQGMPWRLRTFMNRYPWSSKALALVGSRARAWAFTLFTERTGQIMSATLQRSSADWMLRSA